MARADDKRWLVISRTSRRASKSDSWTTNDPVKCKPPSTMTPLYCIVYCTGHASEFHSRLILWQNKLLPGTSSHDVIPCRVRARCYDRFQFVCCLTMINICYAVMLSWIMIWMPTNKIVPAYDEWFVLIRGRVNSVWLSPSFTALYNALVLASSACHTPGSHFVFHISS